MKTHLPPVEEGISLPREIFSTKTLNSSKYSSAMFACAAWITLVLLIPITYIGFGKSPQLGSAFVYSLVFIIYSGSVLAYMPLKSKFEPIRAVFHIFFYSSLGIAAMCQQVTGFTSYIEDENLRYHANMVCLMAMISFELGHLLDPLRRWRNVTNAPGELNSPHSRFLGHNLKRLRAVSTASIILTLVYVALVGSLSAFATDRQTLDSYTSTLGGSTSGQAISGIITAIGTVPVLLSLAAWCLVSKRELSSREFAQRRWYVAILLFANIVVNNPITNSRYWFLTVAVTLLFSMLAWRSGLLKKLVVVGAVVAVTLFPYSDVTRYDATGSVQRQGSNLAEVLATKDYDQLTMTANGIWYVEHFQHTDGNQILGSLFFWVPRQVWPGKPQDTGVMIGEALGAANVNLSSPLWIEVWIDFGILGSIIAFGLLGCLAARIEAKSRRMLSARTDYSYIPLSLACFFFAGYSFILLRGPLLQAMGRLGVAIVFFALLSKVVFGSSMAKTRIGEIVAGKI